jgi:hypothetical protein
MSGEKSLYDSFHRFSVRASFLSNAFVTPPISRTPHACSDSHELGREGSVIQLQDHWATFVRRVVMTCSTQKHMTAGGRHYQGPFSTEVAALNSLRATFVGKSKKPPYWEPTWFDAVQVIDAVSRLGLPNSSQLSLGLGITPSPNESLRAIRNFFAHRTRRTASEMNRVANVANSAEAHAFLSERVTGGATRFEQWVSQLLIIARQVVE